MTIGKAGLDRYGGEQIRGFLQTPRTGFTDHIRHQYVHGVCMTGGTAADAG